MRLVSLALDYLRSDSSALRKTSGRLLPSLYLVGPGRGDLENYSGQSVGPRAYPGSEKRSEAMGQIGQGPRVESVVRFDLRKKPQRIRSTESVGLYALNSLVSN